MIPRCSRDCVRLLLGSAVVLNCALSTSSMKQCERNYIRNLGIKLCQLKCNENNRCSDFAYHVETLPCPLSRNDSKKNEKHQVQMELAQNNSKVQTGPCASETCRLAERCLPTRPRKAICEQDEKRDYPRKHKVEKQDSFENRPLHIACRNGNLHGVRRILHRRPIDINSRDASQGRTPLMVAAKEGHCRIFEFLMRNGANMLQVDNDGKNILHWAYKGGHMGMAECVLPYYGVDIKQRHVIPIILAASKGQMDVLDFLLCMGANVSQEDDNGNTVLHWACKVRHVRMVKYLLSLGSVDINSRRRDGLTPLMIAAGFGLLDMFELLVCMGANVSHVDGQLDNILHYASEGGRAKMVKYILSKNMVDVNSRGRFERTPLMKAAYHGHINVFDQLARKGGLTRVVDDNGNNILHLAAVYGRLKMVKHILSQNMVDINARNKNGKTAAMIVKHYRKRRVYNFLVSRGCPVK